MSLPLISDALQLPSIRLLARDMVKSLSSYGPTLYDHLGREIPRPWPMATGGKRGVTYRYNLPPDPTRHEA